MNDDNQFSFVGDEAMEARIIAWVLGEASPFEAEELERICQEQPKWAAFKRRIAELHGLLEEASKPVEAEWSLPAGKRAVVEATLQSPPQKRSVPHIAWWRMPSVQAAAASIGILGVAGVLLAPIVFRKKDTPEIAENSGALATAPVMEGKAQAAETERLGRMRIPEPPSQPFGSSSSRSNASRNEAQREAGEVAHQPKAEQSAASFSSETKDRDTAGNRAGDVATTRNSIDAVLNNPNRVGGDIVDEEAIAKQDAQAPKPSAGGGAGGGFGRGTGIGMGVGYSSKDRQVVFRDEATKENAAADAIASSASAAPAPATAPAAPIDLAAADRQRAAEQMDAKTNLAAARSSSGVKMREDQLLFSDSGVARSDDSPIRSNAAATQPPVPADELRRKLYLAEGSYNLGKYDDARREYNAALRVDPNNAAARRGLEKADEAKSDYDKAAYDEARSMLLSQAGQDGADSAPSGAPAPSSKLAEPADAFAGKKQEGEVPTLGDLPVVGNLFSNDIAGVEQTLRNQEDLVEEKRKVLDQIVRTKGFPYDSDKSIEQNANLQEEGRARGLNQREFIEAKGRLDVEQKKLLEMRQQLQQKKQHAEPAKPKPDVSKEMPTAKEPFSTFSLHVSDASFRLAVAAMARGEWPDADRVRAEEFYNAFEYGDSAPAANEPVACVIEQSAHPLLPQRNLLRIGVRAGSSGRGAGVPLHLTVLLDNSGSMERDDRRESVRAALMQLTGLLGENDTITLVGFSRTPRLVADRVNGAKASEIVDLAMKMPAEGGTNLEQALVLGEELAKRQFAPNAQNRIVLLTDGAANLGNAKPEDLAKEIEELRQQGLAFDAAGIGAEGLNDKMLEALTRKGDGRYYVVRNPDDAGAGFAKKLAGAFRPAAENVKVQVRWNPRRVKGYLLNGFEEHRLNKEDFRNDAVDAAEMAAEEAGQALYQVDVLPDGEGELGEVSVRFLDAASGKMVERAWTIPYVQSALAFDRATPSMQLAGLALMTAEKLRGGPLADAVEFSSFAPTAAAVRLHYANDKRVGELIEMIGKLK